MPAKIPNQLREVADHVTQGGERSDLWLLESRSQPGRRQPYSRLSRFTNQLSQRLSPNPNS